MHRIDLCRPVTIYGTVTRDLSKMTGDPFHHVAMDLAQERMDPAFLRLADPIEEAAFQVPAAGLVQWLADRIGWHEEFFRDLQSIAQTAAGEPLLTTWLLAPRFWLMLEEGRSNPALDQIAAAAKAWRLLGIDEVFFDFCICGTSTMPAQTEKVPETIAA